MFNNHTMSVVTNLNTLGPSINDVDFMAIAVVSTCQYPNLPNFYNFEILIPPTEMLMKWADGDRFILQNQYPLYLASQLPDEMIVALLALLTRKNIVIYIPNDEFNVFGPMLLQHLYFTYGITCNTPSSTFSINQNKIPFIISKFYMIDVMSAKDYLDMYPANALLPPFVINKLAEDMHPFVYRATFDQYAEYFNKLNASKGTHIEYPNMVEVVDKK